MVKRVKPKYTVASKKKTVLKPAKIVYSSGATRNNDAESERFDLISPYADQRKAKVYAEGALSHGERNWEKGMPVKVILNHAKRHLNMWERGDRSEDHIAKVAWGMDAIMHLEETGKAIDS